jgi:hypothetical protein
LADERRGRRITETPTHQKTRRPKIDELLERILFLRYRRPLLTRTDSTNATRSLAAKLMKIDVKLGASLEEKYLDGHDRQLLRGPSLPQSAIDELVDEDTL